MIVTGVWKEDIPKVWDQVEPLIESALSRGRGEMLASDVLAFLLSGDMQLWAAFEDNEIMAVCTTEIINFPRLRVCRLAHAAGRDMHKWKHGKELIKAWAKSQGCDEVWGGGRKGWLRILGWEPAYYICAEKCDA